MPEPRKAVQRMRAYSPPTGGRHDKLRLDFNENTVGCSPRVISLLREAVTGGMLATYPDYERVRGDLASFFGVDESQMLLTNGTDEAIQVLINTFVEAGDEVLILTPSYAMYRFYAELAGAAIVEVGYRSGDLGFDLAALLSAVADRTKAILISNPNNPTGSVISEADIRTILEAVPDACVLVDEAYFDFYGETVLPLVSRFENLFVSRTFSKAHGMAALRIGCLFSQEANAAMMRKAQSPYSVNMLAALAAGEAVKDGDYVRDYVARTLEGRSSIEEALTKKGLRFWPSQANFVLFDAGDRADEFLRQCAGHGVLIRDRRHEIPGALRVTAGPEQDVARFIAILEELS